MGAYWHIISSRIITLRVYVVLVKEPVGAKAARDSAMGSADQRHWGLGRLQRAVPNPREWLSALTAKLVVHRRLEKRPDFVDLLPGAGTGVIQIHLSKDSFLRSASRPVGKTSD